MKTLTSTPQVCDWKFSLTSVDTWEQMLLDCERARETIDFEQFIFANDDIGRRFCELFIKKAKEGVKVRLLFDTVGSYTMMSGSLVDDLKKAGAEVLFFVPFNPLKFDFPSWAYRDHKKILVIDQEIGYIGGVGIQQSFEGWRDTHVRICGDPIVLDMLEDFNRMWKLAGDKKFRPFRRRRYFRQSGFKLVHHSPFHNQKFLYEELLKAVQKAKSYVYLTTPYFIPSFRLLRAMKEAGERGVDVRLLLPSVSDMSWVNTASKYYFRSLLKSDVKVFLYKNRMIH
ncbi:MAG TPA: phospholipase D-like domain-containing protein, partial [Candidatus Paceibacterota bacterium]|nr:phospholipase D-like domain-containing protein [Candidatus Paceibacterota bacterium]